MARSTGSSSDTNRRLSSLQSRWTRVVFPTWRAPVRLTTRKTRKLSRMCVSISRDLYMERIIILRAETRLTSHYPDIIAQVTIHIPPATHSTNFPSR
jgi:hypothetical protein